MNCAAPKVKLYMRLFCKLGSTLGKAVYEDVVTFAVPWVIYCHHSLGSSHKCRDTAKFAVVTFVCENYFYEVQPQIKPL